MPPPNSSLSTHSRHGVSGPSHGSLGSAAISIGRQAAAGPSSSFSGQTDQHSRGRRHAGARLPHALSHTSETVVNIVRLSWSPSPRRNASPNPSVSASFDASPAASQSLHTPAPSNATPKPHYGFSPQNMAPAADSITFSWRRYELGFPDQGAQTPVADNLTEAPSNSSVQASSRAAAVRRLSCFRSLLKRCTLIESSATSPQDGGLPTHKAGQTAEVPDGERSVFGAGEHLRGRLLYAFETQEEIRAANLASQDTIMEAKTPRATLSVSGSKSSRKRKRAPSVSGQTAKTPSTSLPAEYAPGLLQPLAAVWIFEAIPASELRSSQTKNKDLKGKGKAREQAQPSAVPIDDHSPSSDSDSTAYRRRISEILASEFVLKASGTIQPTSSSAYPTLVPASTSNPSSLLPSRRHRRTHEMLTRALEERLVSDFIRAHGWDGLPVPIHATADEEPTIAGTEQFISTDGIAVPDAVVEVPQRPRSETMLSSSSSEEGEIAEEEEGEQAEDGAIEEESPSAQPANEDPALDTATLPGAETPQNIARLPRRRPQLTNVKLVPMRFGSFVVLLPDQQASSSIAWPQGHLQRNRSVLCVRLRADVTMDALVYTATPTHLWLRQITGEGDCQSLETLQDLELVAGRARTKAMSETDDFMDTRPSVCLAPFGLIDEWREHRWKRCCMPAPEGVFPDLDEAIEATMDSTANQDFLLIGALSAGLNDSVSTLVNAGAASTDANGNKGPVADNGTADPGSYAARSPGWWIPERLRTALEEEGIDLTVLGTQPQWAVVSSVQRAGRRDSSAEPFMPSATSSLEIHIDDGIAMHASMQRSRSATASANSLPQDAVEAPRLKQPNDVSECWGFPNAHPDIFLWPLPLCFRLPSGFWPPHTRKNKASQRDGDRTLPFAEIRGAPIYPPSKPLASSNVADILSRAFTLVKQPQDERNLEEPHALSKSTSKAFASRDHASLSGKEATGATQAGDNHARAMLTAHEDSELSEDLQYGLPTHKTIARYIATLTSAASTELQPTVQMSQIIASPSSSAASNPDDVWNAVLGTTSSTAYRTSEPNTTHRPIGAQELPMAPQNGTIRPREADGFDAMDLVTEDDFSFFDNVTAFDFGGLTGAGIGGSGMPLQSSTAPMLDDVTLGTEPTVGSGSLPSHHLTTAADTRAALMIPSDSTMQLNHMLVPVAGPISVDTGPSQTTTDYPSLPGFTPSSLSASSPAFGFNGQATGKTPRTPYSPMDEINDQTISIHTGNEYPSLKQHLASLGRPPGSGPGFEPFDQLRSSEGVPTSLVDKMKHDGVNAWEDPQQLHDKYDSGKFAMPSTETPGTMTTEAATAKTGDQAQTTLLPRTPTRQRFRFITRRGVAKGPVHGTPSKRKHAEQAQSLNGRAAPLSLALAHLRAHRADEEYSEVGTMDTYTDSGSTTDSAEESEDGDSAAVEEVQTKVLLSRLLAGAELALQTAVATKLQTKLQSAATSPAAAQTSSKPDDDGKGDEVWRRAVMDYISTNPPLRAQSLAEQSDSLTLPSVAAHEVAHIVERLSAAVAGPYRDLSHLLLQNVVDSPAVFDANPVELPTGLVPLGGSPADTIAGVDVLEPPYIMAGCQGFVTRLAPTALKFWDKLGLSAVGGPKNVAPFVLQLDPSEYLLSSAIKWLERIHSIFQTYGLGSHAPNTHSILRLSDGSAIDIAEVLGAMAIDDAQQERWEDTMRSILDTLRIHARDASHIIIYVVGTPGWPMRWQGLTRMREELSAMARQRFGPQGWQLLLTGVPQNMIFESGTAPIGAGHRPGFDLKRFAFAMYDSLQRVVPSAKGKITGPGGQNLGEGLDLVQYPAFTLAPLFQRHLMDISLRWPLSSRDVIDRGLLLHVGYELRAARDSVLITIMDQRGQATFTDAWRTKDSLVDDLVMVWLKTVQFARRSSIMWRIVLCKTSPMSMDEVLAWSSLERCGMLRGSGILDVTLACVDTDSPISFLPTASAPPGTPKAPAAPGAVMLDSSQFAYALYPSYRVPVPSPLYRSHYTTSAQLHQSPAPPPRSQHHHDTILALASSATVRVPLHTDYSTASAGTFSTHVFSVPAQRFAPHTLWLHILQVYSNDIPAPLSAAPDRYGRDVHGSHGHFSKYGGVGGTLSSPALPNDLDPFLSAQAALHGRSALKAQSHFASKLRHGSPMSASADAGPSSASGPADHPSVSSTGGGGGGGGPLYANSPALTTSASAPTSHSATAAAAAAAQAASAATRLALHARLRDITQSMHELQLLSTERYALSEPASLLPAHLGLLAVSAPGMASYSPMSPPPVEEQDD